MFIRITIYILLLMGPSFHISAQAIQKNDSPEITLSDADKIFGLSQIWQEAKYSFVFFDQVPRLDWDKAYKEYISKVLATNTTLEYYLELSRFCALLKDGHTDVMLPAALRDKLDQPAIYVEDIQHRAIIHAVDTSLEAEIPLGSEILKVDGIEIMEYLKCEVFPLICSSTEHILWDNGIRGDENKGYGLLVGRAGSPIRITVKTTAGDIQEINLIRDRKSRKIKWVSSYKKRELLEWKWIEDGIAYVALNSFGDMKIVEEFEKIIPKLQTAKGMIIDLRYNGGGSDNIVSAILNHLTDKPYQGFKWKTREHRGAYKAWGKYYPDNEEVGPYYKGDAWYEEPVKEIKPTDVEKILVPLVILTSHNTGSAAEDLLIFMDKMDHVSLVGQRTHGSTGQPIEFNLPGGGAARVCSLRCTYPDGREFVGYGVQPDVLIEPTVESFRRDVDLVLLKGLEVISFQIKEAKKLKKSKKLGKT